MKKVLAEYILTFAITLIIYTQLGNHTPFLCQNWAVGKSDKDKNNIYFFVGPVPFERSLTAIFCQICAQYKYALEIKNLMCQLLNRLSAAVVVLKSAF